MGLAFSGLLMGLYSLLLMAVLVLGAPYWLARMAGSGRYRAGLGQRLGRVPAALREAAAEGQVVWVHAVSVGEVLAATRLVAELEAALGKDWVVVVSTTTATGHALARERFGSGATGAGRVFYYPLDFAWAVRAYLWALRPKLLVLMESELWPRMLVECGRAGVPVAVVNARVSDRSYARGQRVRAVWGLVLRRVDLFLAQSEEDARRLAATGARAEGVRAAGNLKYDISPPQREVVEMLRPLLERRSLVVAGSLLESEEEALLGRWWWDVYRETPEVILVLAPRHPERFSAVADVFREPGAARGRLYLASELLSQSRSRMPPEKLKPQAVVLLDTIGDLAALYSLADVAFVGGSLVAKGGHNPLEPAQFGVPVVMGPSFENFRDVVGKMQAADGIRIVQDQEELQTALVDLLTDREKARAMGERGRRVFEEQQGATARAVEALVGLVKQ